MNAGYGPETISAHGLRNGKYRFRVSEYKGPAENQERLKNSEAQVLVYTAVGVKIFEVGREGDGFVKVRRCGALSVAHVVGHVSHRQLQHTSVLTHFN